eukprot:GHVP01036664.1.p1 GENE.GHVP01036664.1~~GHVP01036664.1.p1  ORF type:complete len:305 (+),score=54.87 GHVP01036664.1:30-944(+)
MVHAVFYLCLLWPGRADSVKNASSLIISEADRKIEFDPFDGEKSTRQWDLWEPEVFYLQESIFYTSNDPVYQILTIDPHADDPFNSDIEIRNLPTEGLPHDLTGGVFNGKTWLFWVEDLESGNVTFCKGLVDTEDDGPSAIIDVERFTPEHGMENCQSISDTLFDPDKGLFILCEDKNLILIDQLHEAKVVSSFETPMSRVSLTKNYYVLTGNTEEPIDRDDASRIVIIDKDTYEAGETFAFWFSNPLDVEGGLTSSFWVLYAGAEGCSDEYFCDHHLIVEYNITDKDFVVEVGYVFRNSNDDF